MDHDDEALVRFEVIDASLKRFNVDIENLSECVSSDKQMKKFTLLQEVSARLRRDIRMLEMECRTLNSGLVQQWRPRVKQLNERLQTAIRELNWSKPRPPNTMAIADAETSIGQESKAIAYGEHLQSESAETAERTLQLVAMTKHTAVSTAVHLREQTEQLKRVYDEAFDIEDNMSRGVFIVKRMLRRTATDKAIWCLTLLIVIALIVILILKSGMKPLPTNIANLAQNTQPKSMSVWAFFDLFSSPNNLYCFVPLLAIIVAVLLLLKTI